MQWALPRLGMRWRGFRRVRRQVCRRIRLRYRALGLADLDAYRARLERDEAEWRVLDGLCRVTISRFFRNQRVFQQLPALAAALTARAGDRALRVWSAGCASGEEPYSVVLALMAHSPPVEVVATDADPHMVERARAARYAGGTLRELDEETVAVAFEREGDAYVLSPAIRTRVRFLVQDVRREAPEGLFDLVLCRNLAFTYFDEATQRATLARFAEHTVPGGALILGSHETLPEGTTLYAAWDGFTETYRRQPGGAVP